MKRFLPLLVLIILFSSCKKNKNSGDFLRDRSFGSGTALFIAATGDSGLVACGKSDSRPLLVRLDNSFSTVLEVADEEQGLFSSAWFDTAGYISGGNSRGNILLARYSKTGREIWRKTIDAGYHIDLTTVLNTSSGNMLAVCSAATDSVSSGASGLYFVRFDTTGIILSQQNIASSSFIAAGNAATDDIGNIYLSITKAPSGAKSVAAVAKYNDQLQKLWETDLYNNPGFSAASRSVMIGRDGNVYVTGNTEVSTSQGIQSNSFVVSLDNNGNIRDNWKRYPENSNEGEALLFNDAGNVLLMNRNCFIVNVLEPDDGSAIDRINMISFCYTDDTDAFGEDFALSGDNILLAGSLGGDFFICMKSME
jgi:hypothetical protein